MSIENNQARHNQIISAIGNASASNDPHQIPNDANEVLLKGAGLIASGNNLGLSEEEVLRAVSRKARREKKREIEDERAYRQAKFEQGGNTLLNEQTIDDERGYTTVGSDELTEEQIFQGQTDIEGGFRSQDGEYYDKDAGRYVSEEGSYRPEADEEYYSRTYRPGTKREARYQYKDRVRPQEETNNSFATAPTGPTGPLGDALRRLKQGLPPGVQGPAASPEMIARLEERLGQVIDPRKAKAAERQAVIEMIAADAANSDPEIRQRNDAKAESEALQIMQSVGIPGQETYEEVSGLGAVKMRGPDGEITLATNSNNMPIAVQSGGVSVDIDENGNIVKTVDNQYVDPVTGTPLSDTKWLMRDAANAPNTSQAANAPKPQDGVSWIAANLPEFRQSSSNFGDYPQTDIALSTSNFAQKVRELSGFGTGNVNLDVRSVADLENMVGAVYEGAAAKGQQIFRRGPDNTQIPAEPGDIQGVMDLLKLSGPEQTDLANALFQIETAGTQNARNYQNRTGTPAPTRVNMGTEVEERGQATLARVPKNSMKSAGTNEDGSPRRATIRSLLAQLEGNDAQTPFIGAVIDPKTKKQEKNAGPSFLNRFIGPGMTEGPGIRANLRAQAEARLKKGQKLDIGRLNQNVRNAETVVARENDSSARRAQQASDIIATLPPAARSSRLPGTQFRESSRDVTPIQEKPSGSPSPRLAEDDMFSKEADRRFKKTGGVSGVRSKGGPLATISSPSRSQEPSSQYYDGNNDYDVVARYEDRRPQRKAPDEGVKQRASTNAEISRRLKQEIAARADAGRQQRIRRIGGGGAALGGAALAAAGISDAVDREEGIIRY